MEKKAWEVSTIAGGKKGSKDGTGEEAQFNYPEDVTVDVSGNVYVADCWNHCIRKITPEGEVTTLAGNSAYGYKDGTGRAAQFYSPFGVAADTSGNVFVGDAGNCRIRKITPEGEVTTLAGNSAIGFKDGTGTVAQLIFPSGVAADTSGNVFVADTYNQRIRKITPKSEVTTIAGGTDGYKDGIGEAAEFELPNGVAVDSSDNVYVADTDNHRIRKITPEGEVTTLAGSTKGYEEGIGEEVQFCFPSDVAVDGSGNVYVADKNNNRIRKITPGGVVTTITGTGATAQFDHPSGVAVDSSGNVYVADTYNQRIRKIEYK